MKKFQMKDLHKGMDKMTSFNMYYLITFLLNINLQSIKSNYAICQWEQLKLDFGSGLRRYTPDKTKKTPKLNS